MSLVACWCESTTFLTICEGRSCGHKHVICLTPVATADPATLASDPTPDPGDREASGSPPSPPRPGIPSTTSHPSEKPSRINVRSEIHPPRLHSDSIMDQPSKPPNSARANPQNREHNQSKPEQIRTESNKSEHNSPQFPAHGSRSPILVGKFSPDAPTSILMV